MRVGKEVRKLAYNIHSFVFQHRATFRGSILSLVVVGALFLPLYLVDSSFSRLVLGHPNSIAIQFLFFLLIFTVILSFFRTDLRKRRWPILGSLAMAIFAASGNPLNWGIDTKRATPRSCEIRVQSDPIGATVYLDEQDVGAAPITIKNVIPGRHAVKVCWPGQTIAAGATMMLRPGGKEEHFFNLSAQIDAEKELKSLPGPRFNRMLGDHELIRAARMDRTDWSTIVDANVGDRVAIMLYYHNAKVDSIAHNTCLRVDLPLDSSRSHVLKGHIWSRETKPLTSTVIGGKILGPGGITVRLPMDGRIVYVPGSTKWFASSKQRAIAMPDSIASSAGLCIGSVLGCWEHSGYVTLLVDVMPPSTLVMDKTVAHPGSKDGWKERVLAKPNDVIAYHIGIRNDSKIKAISLTLKDDLPKYTTLVPGTTYLYTKEHPDGHRVSDGTLSEGIKLPDMVSGAEGIAYVTYKVRIAKSISELGESPYLLNNVASLYMNSMPQDTAQAQVVVKP